MTPSMVYPDAEAVVIDYLDQHFGAVRADIPDPRPSEFIRVRRIGGVSNTPVSDAALLTIEAWSTHPAAAYEVLAEARARLKAMAHTVQDGVTIYRVNEVGGPVNLPDDTSQQARYTLTIEVALRGEPLSA